MIEKWIRSMRSQSSLLTDLKNTYIFCLPGSHSSDPTPTHTPTPDTPASKFSVTAFHDRSAAFD